MESICSVYILTLPNNKIYVGYTSMSPDELWADNGDVYENNKRLYPDIQVAGWNNIKREIVYINLSRSDALEKKKKLCLKYKSYLPEYGYNRPCDAGIKKDSITKQIHNVDKLYLAEDNKYYQSEKSYLNKKERNRILDDYTMSFVKITDKGLLAIIKKRAKQYNNDQLIKMTEILKTNEKYITNIIKTKRFENNYGKIGYIEKIILNKANE